MDALRQYVISVVSAAILCSILTGLLNKGVICDLLKLICGVLLTVVLLNPLISKNVFHFRRLDLIHGQEAQAAAAAGETYSLNALSTVIKKETEAYILDKAKDMNLNLTVDITLSQDIPPVPVVIHLTGTAAPLARQKLTETVINDLGIAKENLIWIG